MPNYTPASAVPYGIDGDARFRQLGSAISAGFLACGLVKGSDTGQIDWTTVTRPASATTSGAFAGFEIWKFGDALQATSPFALRIDYGLSGYGTDNPALKITVGRTTDGAGTFNDPITPPAVNLWNNILGTSTNTNAYLHMAGSATSGRIAFHLARGDANSDSALIFGFERIRTTDNTVSANGALFVVASTGTGTSVNSYFIPPTGTYASSSVNAWPIPAIMYYSRTSSGENIAMGGLVVPNGQVYGGVNFLAYNPADVAGNFDVIQVAVYNQNRNYLTTSIMTSPGFTSSAGGGSPTLAMIWD